VSAFDLAWDAEKQVPILSFYNLVISMKPKIIQLAGRFPGNAICAIFALLLLRMALHQSLHFSFLVWNIFLAVLPLNIASAARRTTNNTKAIALSALWLLLFPNAAYLVTDIVHLRLIPGQRFWLDLVLLFGAGVLGIGLSLQSLRETEKLYARWLQPRYLPLLSIAVLILSGYGIYLGRVSRWNSWDPLLQPLALLRDIFNDFRHPFRNSGAWRLTALFGAMQVGSYLLSRSGAGIANRNEAG
jgi:uncharacterized membrane protein